MKEILKAAEAAGGQVMQESADLSYLDDLRTWKQAGKEITDNSYLPQLVEAIRKQTNENMKAWQDRQALKPCQVLKRWRTYIEENWIRQ